MNKQLQKYFPFILVILTLILGAGILFQKGLFTIPSFGSKTNIVSLKKPSVVDILFSGNEFKLSYAGMPATNIINIGKFDKTEQWQGAGSIDEDVASGNLVLSLVDRDRNKADAYLLKNFNFSSVDTIKLAINLKSDPDNLEAVNILFGNKGLTNYYRFPVSNLKDGLNYLAIPKYRFFLAEGNSTPDTKNTSVSDVSTKAGTQTGISWDKIERVQLELVSRPGTKANIELGWIKGEKEGIFDPDWNWSGGDQFLNLDLTKDGKTTLLAQNIGGTVATLKKLGSVKDFTYTAKLTSLKKGSIGLFFRGDYKTGYGYYLTVGGLDTSDWSVSKYNLVDTQQKTSILLNGQIGNFEFSKDQSFWLKVTVKGNSIQAYFSLDGKDFTKLGEVNDSDIAAGGVGLALSSGAAGYFDDFGLQQK